MKSSLFILLMSAFLFAPPASEAQEGWPRSITAADGSVILIYPPQPDSFRNNLLKYRAAFSLTRKGETQSRFGSFLALAGVETDKDSRLIHLTGASILSLTFSLPLEPGGMDELRETLECGIPGAGADISLDEVLSSLERDMAQPYVSRGFNNSPPRIIVAGRPTMLVLIDGTPRLKRNGEWDLKAVVNTPYTIVESTDGWFYLYGGRHWYIAPAPTGPFHLTGYIAPDVSLVQESIMMTNTRNEVHTDTLREGADIAEDIVVSTIPAELIQTRGAPVFIPLAGTRLKYAGNTNNDLFLDTVSRRYYALLSGRWYRSHALIGSWSYIPGDSLPSDFSSIPEGSPKDNVLASIPGTYAAREAVQEACIPQTARVDRRKADTHVSYDGNPKFADIPGTHLQYALNTASIVLLYQHKFYALDKGVWFWADFPKGPWELCLRRPEEVDLIPPECPVYPCKYVYIYGVTPGEVYTGYTAGYLNSFISGGTLVYGTGYHYPAWSDNRYYPRPQTWGFNMWYNPWVGYSLGYDFGLDWFNAARAWQEGFRTGGWWGPPEYRPPYVWHHFSGHGLYVTDMRKVENISYNNDIYSPRPDIVTRSLPVPLYTDSEGNVYRREGGDGWAQREGGEWLRLDSSRSATWQVLNQQEKLRARGEMRKRNFQHATGGREVQAAYHHLR
jgi:hypothetical protein